MRKSMLLMAILAMQLTVISPALAQDASGAGVPVGGVTEDGFVRTSNGTLVDCDHYLSGGGQYEEACREAGFSAEEPGTRTTLQGNDACKEFPSQAEAQAALDADPSDPNGLDTDGNGIACERVSYSPDEPDVAARTGEDPDLSCIGLSEAEGTPDQPSPEAGQEQAQAILAEDPNDPNGLDTDGDGVACEFERGPTGIDSFEDGTGFLDTAAQAEEPQQYSTPSEETAPVTPDDVPDATTKSQVPEVPEVQPTETREVPVAQPGEIRTGAVTPTSDEAPEQKPPSSTPRGSTLTELPATGGHAPMAGAAVFMLCGVSLLVLAASRGRSS